MCPRTYVHKYRAQGRPLQPPTGDEENGEKREKNAKTKEKAKAVSEACAPLTNIYVFVGFATKHIYITRLCFFPLRNIYLLGGYAVKHIYITYL